MSLSLSSFYFSHAFLPSQSDNMKKKESKIQLSPIVFIGPPDAILRKPVKINIPHCVPTDTSAWHVKVKLCHIESLILQFQENPKQFMYMYFPIVAVLAVIKGEVSYINNY